MIEKRGTQRWCIEQEEKATIVCSGNREVVRILDISTGGMKVIFTRPLTIGEVLYGEFKILPQLGTFFVQGRVMRVLESQGLWEISISFDKVSSLPLQPA